MNTSFDRIITETLQNHGNEVFDNITTNNALLYMLRKRGNIKVVSGGRKFTHPLYYALNSSFKTYGKLDAIETPLPDNLTRAEYDIKIAAGSLVISTLEEAMNAGDKEKLLDLGAMVKMDAENSMSELLGDQVWKDGTVANDFDGLQQLISISPSTQTDVGGINPTTYSYWRNQVDTATITAFNTNQEGLLAWNAMRDLCTYGRKGPRLVVTTRTVYGLYEAGLTSNLRYATTELGDSGFVHLAYTTMPVVWDDNCPSNYTYMIDTDSIWLQVLAQGNNKITEFRPSTNQLVKTALYYIFGNLTTGSRRTSGVLSGSDGT